MTYVKDALKMGISIPDILEYKRRSSGGSQQPTGTSRTSTGPSLPPSSERLQSIISQRCRAMDTLITTQTAGTTTETSRDAPSSSAPSSSTQGRDVPLGGTSSSAPTDTAYIVFDSPMPIS